MTDAETPLSRIQEALRENQENYSLIFTKDARALLEEVVALREARDAAEAANVELTSKIDRLLKEIHKLDDQVDQLAAEERKARIEEMNPYKERVRVAGIKNGLFGVMLERLIFERDEYRREYYDLAHLIDEYSETALAHSERVEWLKRTISEIKKSV